MDKLGIVKYEVIADYPASMFKMGEIVEVYEGSGMTYMVEIDMCSEKYDVRDFPHLFKKLEE